MAVRRTPPLRTWVRTAILVTPEHGKKNPDSDRVNWGIPHVQFDLSRIIHERDGKCFLINLREKDGDAAKRALVRFMAASTTRDNAWIS